MAPRILPAADSAVLVVLGDAPSAAMSERVLRLDAAVAAAGITGVGETVPGLASLLVEYDATRTSQGEMVAALRDLAVASRQPRAEPASPPRSLRLPVCYAPEMAPDLETVAARTGLTPEEVIRLHASATYRVAMVGHLPGLPYLLGLPPRLDLPRRGDPRTRVPAGSVGIAAGLSCVYPVDAPGGWHILGRCPLPLFDTEAAPPGLLAPGDEVRLEPITAERFAALQAPTRSPAMRTDAGGDGPCLQVLRPGPLTTVQDMGRRGLLRLGVAPGGAMDPQDLHLANLLAGNAPGAAALEVTVRGPSLRVEAAAVRIAAPALDCVVETAAGARWPVPPLRSVTLRRGDILHAGAPRRGLRGCIAVGGGIAVPPLLGSASTFLRGRFGGLDGRALAPGDVLPLHEDGPHTGADLCLDAAEDELWPGGPLRIVPGPHHDLVPREVLALLTTAEYTVVPRSDRGGLRLDGPALPRGGVPEVVSEGCAAGSIQVPGSGLPIVLLAERGTTGGYPKPATVISADLPRLGRLRPGERLRFAAVTVDEAEEARRQRSALLESWRTRLHHCNDM